MIEGESLGQCLTNAIACDSLLQTLLLSESHIETQLVERSHSWLQFELEYNEEVILKILANTR